MSLNIFIYNNHNILVSIVKQHWKIKSWQWWKNETTFTIHSMNTKQCFDRVVCKRFIRKLVKPLLRRWMQKSTARGYRHTDVVWLTIKGRVTCNYAVYMSVVVEPPACCIIMYKKTPRHLTLNANTEMHLSDPTIRQLKPGYFSSHVLEKPF